MNEKMDNGGKFTDRLLDEIGIMPGQTALDVGCGVGDVTFRLARCVGQSGTVVGVDLNNAALELAKERAEKERIQNVTFIEADLFELPPAPQSSGYDVVTCRRVLMYLPDKLRAVKALLAALRPGGRLALQEHDGSLMASTAPLPLNERAHKLIWETVQAEGADIALGLKLHAILVEAGASQPAIMAEAAVETADQYSPTAMIIEALADRIVAAGVATREDVETLDLSTLDERLSQERRSANASFVAEMIFGALAFKK